VRGETQDGFGGERAGEITRGEEGGVKRFGCLVVRDKDEARSVGGADEEWEIQSARGEGEAGDTSSPAAGAHVATDTVEGHGVFQVREQLADEGENHKLG
jgi:hypothetical protein